jgi:hypothetical protein
MQTTETSTRIVIQPESDIEQRILSETFTRLTNLSEAAGHPTKMGTELVFYTLDLGVYDDLNHDLWEKADVAVDDHGRIDPDPGSRALVIVHGDETADETDETADETDEAVQTIKEAEVSDDNEYIRDAAEVVKRIEAMKPLDREEVDYSSHLQEMAKAASSTGMIDIPANQSREELIEDLETFVDLVAEEEG